jgi:hypothetical protein
MKMALTAEQQAQIDFQNATEAARHANQLELEARRAKLEAIRLAKETLIENARSKPVDSRDVSAADIQAFAQTLVAYING